MTPTIRAAQVADGPSLGRMGEALAREHHRFDPLRFMDGEGFASGYRSWLLREARSDEAVVLVAELGGRVVGYAYGRLEGTDWSTFREACGELQDLWVEPDARGSGIGRALAEAAFAKLVELGAPRVVLHAAARNEPARRLFARLGYRETMVEMTRER